MRRVRSRRCRATPERIIGNGFIRVAQLSAIASPSDTRRVAIKELFFNSFAPQRLDRRDDSANLFSDPFTHGRGNNWGF